MLFREAFLIGNDVFLILIRAKLIKYKEFYAMYRKIKIDYYR